MVELSYSFKARNIDSPNASVIFATFQNDFVEDIKVVPNALKVTGLYDLFTQTYTVPAGLEGTVNVKAFLLDKGEIKPLAESKALPQE